MLGTVDVELCPRGIVPCRILPTSTYNSLCRASLHGHNPVATVPSGYHTNGTCSGNSGNSAVTWGIPWQVMVIALFSGTKEKFCSSHMTLLSTPISREINNHGLTLYWALSIKQFYLYDHEVPLSFSFSVISDIARIALPFA